MANKNLQNAKKAKNDEFYTQLTDVSKELMHYKKHFNGKTVLCNCDDPTWSAFWKYFHLNFEVLGLKKLISTHYDKTEPTYKMEYTGGDDNDIEVGVKTPLEGNGDFRNKECLDLLDECDIVVTNPPFSCYSADTEVMTDKGWELIKDVDISKDTIMSLNPDTKNIEMVKAVDFIKSPVNGELYHFHNRNMDFCVTGNHRMYAYNTYDRSLPFVNAEDMKRGYKLPLSGFSYQGVKKDFFILPATRQLEQYSRKEIVVPEKKIPMKDWLEFFGLYLADGCYVDHINTCGKRDYTISIKQHINNETYVLNLISRIGFKPRISSGSNETNKNYNIYSKQLWEYLSQFGRSQDKFIPREFLDLDKEYLEALFTGYRNGDSSLCADRHVHFSTVSKRLIENIQELILKIYGRVVQYRKDVRKHSYDDNFGECYSINITFDKNRDNYTKYENCDMVSYHDNVYCLTLERNHIMLVRHNEKVGWCGNCFREYVAVLMEHEKKFLIIGSLNAVKYSECFPFIMNNQMWLGNNNVHDFMQPDGTVKKFGNVNWYTNLDFAKRHEKMILWKEYNDKEYPKYETYDAIEVSKVTNIPVNYNGIMGVPVSFMSKYNPEQFEIVGEFNHGSDNEFDLAKPVINGKELFPRIAIRKKVGA